MDQKKFDELTRKLEEMKQRHEESDRRNAELDKENERVLKEIHELLDRLRNQTSASKYRFWFSPGVGGCDRCGSEAGSIARPRGAPILLGPKWCVKCLGETGR